MTLTHLHCTEQFVNLSEIHDPSFLSTGRKSNSKLKPQAQGHYTCSGLVPKGPGASEFNEVHLIHWQAMRGKLTNSWTGSRFEEPDAWAVVLCGRGDQNNGTTKSELLLPGSFRLPNTASGSPGPLLGIA